MSIVKICNQALNHIGESKKIIDLDSDKSQEAKACREFYDDARQETLRDFPWPFAMATEPLTLISDNSGEVCPAGEYAYSYDYPNDCIRLRKVIPPTASPEARSDPYQEASNPHGRSLIMTNVVTAVGVYTKDIQNTVAFRSDFRRALAYKIAQFISAPLARGNKQKMSEKMMQLYDLQISKAEAAAANEGESVRIGESGLERSRR